jgi:hypothetical protein
MKSDLDLMRRHREFMIAQLACRDRYKLSRFNR